MQKLDFIILSLFFSSLFSAHFEEPWGKDRELTSSKKTSKTELSILGKIANSIILFHQRVISPVDGPRSHFRPSSSRYMQLAIERYGFFKGYLMGCDRLLRENNEKWVYRTIEEGGAEYKYDPAFSEKSKALR